ncbi:hypothetical protein [Hymenobacter edaphi]|uniref:Uncharacterized protein n=1 Tax=Hymenobacter edaphi TaxID=2211146 RepID=A0A328BK08_9BACT|nr:hypothetical protein [Hymenobacter edaphi]RAK65308.1 hypothetical protein DLM85_17435 [Hymenobacter edaphi]
MFTFLTIWSTWLLATGSIYQAPPAAFPDVPTITETSVGQARIGMSTAQLKKLYKGCAFSPTSMAAYGFDEHESKPSGVTVSYAGKKLFVYFPDWKTKKQLAGLIALHPAYRTAKGIHVNSTSGQLKAALPGVVVVPNMMDANLEVAFSGSVEKPGIQYVFYKQGNVGNYVVADTPVKISVSNAKITWIQVYPH